LKIDFYKHNIGEEEIDETLGVLRSMFITTASKTSEFESLLSSYNNTKNTIGLTSCTAALFLSLKALDFPVGSEIITTPLSFCSTSNTIIHAGHTPVFVDVSPLTGNINADLIEDKITPKTKAIVPVHLYGHMCDMVKINKIAKKHNLCVIEDAAHCIEGRRDNIRPGETTKGAAYSFYATKTITSGEGGAFSTNDDVLAAKINTLRLHGLSKNAYKRYSSPTFNQYDVTEPGFKYNMFDIQAALLINQVKNIEYYLKKRKSIWDIFDDAFDGKIKRPEIIEGTEHAMHLYTIWTEKEKRDRAIEALFNSGIPVSVHFFPIHLFKYYRETFGYKEGDYPVCEKIASKTITLPFYPKLKNDEISYICEQVLKTLAS
jgi:dTDP-4-amino-4,6-dideoxygalactose transaminase